jgi:hypothetical protein
MRPEREEIAANDVGGFGFNNSVLVRQPRHGLGEQRRELLGSPERGEI